MGNKLSAPVLAAVLLLSGAVNAAANEGPIVATSLGQVRGEQQPGAVFFRGIPYAVAPVGPLRWKPTAPAESWQGVREATRFGADCPQPPREDIDVKQPQSEDCLTLNVVTPDLHGRRLPVLVSIHGGAFFTGSGRYLIEEGISPFVKRGIVLVSPNYRIGRLGFFAHPALRAESGGGPVANYWLMDQIAALKWVKANIARFGGDPDNVTLVGCSAGGSSVNSLLVSPSARGLFQKANVRSGGGLFNANRTLALAEERGIEFAKRAGIDSTDPDVLDKLRALSVATVLASDPGPPDFGAVVDGIHLPQPVAVSFARGEIARVPLMVGSTSNEASVFGLMGFDRQVLKQRFRIELDQVAPAYALDGPLPEAELLRQVQTDFIFTVASIGTSRMAARAGLPAYAYHFDYRTEAEKQTKPGADHCADMGYCFGATPPARAEDQRIARMLQDYLVNFIRTGDPNGEGLPHWPRMPADTNVPLVIGDDTRAVPGFRERQLQVWFDKWRVESGERMPRPR